MTSATEPSGWTIYSDKHVRGRSCAKCSACCIIVPVDLPSGLKPAGCRCPHLRSSGCSIYSHRPAPCRMWSCRWLFDPATADLRRPDIAGYIVDPEMTFFRLDGQTLDAVQVWIDPKRPDAHRDPALRAYLAGCAERFGIAAVIRWGNDEALVLFAPSLTDGGGWREERSKPIPM